MLALLALAAPAVAYYDGPRGYCSQFTARYLRSLGLPPAMVNNYAVAKTPWGFAAIGGGELDTTSPRIGFLENSRILHMTKPTSVRKSFAGKVMASLSNWLVFMNWK